MRDPTSFDRFAGDYDRFASLERPWPAEWLRPHLPRRRHRALDAGCGSGRHSLVLADHFDEVVGVDISGPLIEIARARRPNPRVTYLQADLATLEDDGRFDLVFSASTLHHLADLRAALRQLRGLIAPAGVAVLVDQVSPWPTPPRLVYYLGPMRTLRGHVRRVGWRDAWWMVSLRDESSVARPRHERAITCRAPRSTRNTGRSSRVLDSSGWGSPRR